MSETGTIPHKKPADSDPRPVLALKGISKHFGGVHALEGVSLELKEGEILALVGSNGAGKSTLVSILAGINRPDAGTIELDGTTVEIGSVAESRRRGIEIVLQDLNLVPNMSAPFNVFLGRPLRRFRFFANERAMELRTRELLSEEHVTTVQDLRVPVRSLSGGQRQALAVGRAAAWRNRIVIFDEPAAALGPEETEQVIRLIGNLRQQGSSIIVITHNMDHVFRIADRVVILRNGRLVAQVNCADVSTDQLVNMIMLGLPVDGVVQ